jgi:hypothetical protein
MLGGVWAFYAALQEPLNASPPAVKTSSADLADILQRCADYCDRLSGAVLDFVCLERIEEMIADLAVISRDTESAGFVDTQDLTKVGRSSDPGRMTSLVRIRKRVRSQFIYDYQCIQDHAGPITETRTLIKDHGRSVLEKNAALKTQAFSYKFIVLGPVTLLNRDRQRLFDFQAIKEMTIGKDRAIIIEATPKPESHGDTLSGRVWARTSDAAILKIEWQPESVGNYKGIADLAKQIGGQPHLTLTTEFAFEQKGIRFPSRYRIEESYLFPSGAPLVRSKTDVTLTDYKFFKVETSVAIRSSPAR